jgi:hypothetical protein
MTFNIKSNWVKWIASAICFAIPLVLSLHGAYLDLTVGAILNAIYLYAETKLL